MAVYKKTYRPYEGTLTPSWSRMFVITRYAFEDLRRSKFLNTFYTLSFAYPLICALMIYAEPQRQRAQGVGRAERAGVITINLTFFLNLLGWQSMLALFLAAFIGPGQISPDLANNALSLYLARPFSRVEYVLGKMSVLMMLMSLMTWVPGLLLFGSARRLWKAAVGRRITPASRGASSSAPGCGSCCSRCWRWRFRRGSSGSPRPARWSSACSSWPRLSARPSTACSAPTGGRCSTSAIWLAPSGLQLMEGATRTTNGAVFFRVPHGRRASDLAGAGSAVAMLAAACLYMLARKIRGAEVVR